MGTALPRIDTLHGSTTPHFETSMERRNETASDFSNRKHYSIAISRQRMSGPPRCLWTTIETSDEVIPTTLISASLGASQTGSRVHDAVTLRNSFLGVRARLCAFFCSSLSRFLLCLACVKLLLLLLLPESRLALSPIPLCLCIHNALCLFGSEGLQPHLSLAFRPSRRHET